MLSMLFRSTLFFYTQKYAHCDCMNCSSGFNHIVIKIGFFFFLCLCVDMIKGFLVVIQDYGFFVLYGMFWMVFAMCMLIVCLEMKVCCIEWGWNVI